MLEKVRDAVGARHFYSCLWHCVLCSSNVRLPALLFILLHYDRTKPLDDQIDIIGSSVDVMVCGFFALLFFSKWSQCFAFFLKI